MKSFQHLLPDHWVQKDLWFGLLNFMALDQIHPISPITEWKLTCFHANGEMNENLIGLISKHETCFAFCIHTFSSINCTGAELLRVHHGQFGKVLLAYLSFRSLQGNKVCFSSFYSLAIIKSWLWRKSCVSEFDCNWKIFKYAWQQFCMDDA